MSGDVDDGGVDDGGIEVETAGGEVRTLDETEVEELYPDVPNWDDEYLDRVSDRLMFSYDLERDHTVDGRTFDLYGEMHIESRKQLFHPSLNYANHESEEFLFAHRMERVSVDDLRALVDLGHELADGWVEGHEEHYGTDFTFVLVAPEVTEAIRGFVSGFRERKLLKFGYYGHYEINLAVVAPDEEDAVGSKNADVLSAFTLWNEIEPEQPGLVSRLINRIAR